MMSSYYESLFNSNQYTNSNQVLLPALHYPLPAAFFQLDSSYYVYHEAFFRNLFCQYFQGTLSSSPSSSLLSTPPNIVPSSDSMEKESHAVLTVGNCLRKTSSSITSSNLKVRRRLSCSQCLYTTNRLNNLKRHIQTMHEILSEPIDCCSQLFISKAHFRAHVNTEHRCGYRCDTCRRTFCRKALLRRHQSIHSGQKSFCCFVCSYSTSHKGNLDRHVRIHQHSNEQKTNL